MSHIVRNALKLSTDVCLLLTKLFISSSTTMLQTAFHYLGTGIWIVLSFILLILGKNVDLLVLRCFNVVIMSCKHSTYEYAGEIKHLLIWHSRKPNMNIYCEKGTHYTVL